MASLTFNHGSYYAVFSVSGKKKIWKRIGKVSRLEAKQLLKRLERKFELDRLNLNETKPITLYEYTQKYMEYCGTNKAVSTYQRELPVVDHIRAFRGNVLLTKFDNQKIESYKAHRVAIGLKPRSINRELEILRFMLNKAVEWKYLQDNPYRGVKMLKPTVEPVKYLTEDQIDSLLSVASIHLKPILIVLRNTGMRTHELLNLRFSDIDYGKRIVLVRISKTNSCRIIPLNQESYRGVDRSYRLLRDDSLLLPIVRLTLNVRQVFITNCWHSNRRLGSQFMSVISTILVVTPMHKAN